MSDSVVNNFHCSSSGISSSCTSRSLPGDFTLGDNDVICGRGTTCFNHVGNKKFRDLIISKLGRYVQANAKVHKTLLIIEVVNEIHANSPNGGFVKFDKSTGQYYEVGDFLAREKTSQGFRDALHEHYKSSNMKKKIKRKMLKCAKTDIITDVSEKSCSDDDIALISKPHSVSPTSSVASFSPASSKTTIMNGTDMSNAKFSCFLQRTEKDSFSFVNESKHTSRMIEEASPSERLNEVSDHSDEDTDIIGKRRNWNRRFSISSSIIPLDDDIIKDDIIEDDMTPLDYSCQLDGLNLDEYFHETCIEVDNVVQDSLKDLFELSDDILKIQAKLHENRMMQSKLQRHTAFVNFNHGRKYNFF